MSRRKTTGNPVSLFPFLAVLMSMLGALILLLMAVTRQAQLSRDAANADAIAKQGLPDLPPLPERISFPLLEPLPPRVDEPLPSMVLPALPPLPQKPLDLLARRDALKMQLAELPVISDAMSSERSDRLAELSAYLKQLQRQLDEMIQQGKSQRDATEGLRVELAKLRELQRKLGLGSDHVENRHAIVAYTGPNGTERRPIFLECRRDSITLMPEGIVIGPELLTRPEDPDNPLAATVRAIVSEMNKLDSTSDPYPLLIVRPDGIAAYYLAQRALAEVNVPTGYELVADNVTLDFPKPDPRIESVARVVLGAFQRSSPSFANSISDGTSFGNRPGLGRPSPGSNRGGSGSLWDPPQPSPIGASGRVPAGNPPGIAGTGNVRGSPDASPGGAGSLDGRQRQSDGAGSNRATGLGGDVGTGQDIASVMDEFRSGPIGRARNANRSAGTAGSSSGKDSSQGDNAATGNSPLPSGEGQGDGSGSNLADAGELPLPPGEGRGEGSGAHFADAGDLPPGEGQGDGSGSNLADAGELPLPPGEGQGEGSGAHFADAGDLPPGEGQGDGSGSNLADAGELPLPPGEGRGEGSGSTTALANVRAIRPSGRGEGGNHGATTAGPALGQPSGGAFTEGMKAGNQAAASGGSSQKGQASAGSQAGNAPTGMTGASGGDKPTFDDLLFPQPDERPKPGENAVEVDTFALEPNPGEGKMRGVSGLKIDRRQIRRQVMIECREDGLILYPGQTYIPIDPTTSLDQVAADVTRHVIEQVQNWRRTGGMHYWQPVVTFYVRPDGLSNYYGMRFSLVRSKLELDHRVIDWNMVLEVPKLLRDKQTSVVLPSVIRL